MREGQQQPSKLLHLLCDFEVGSPEYSVSQAQLLHAFPEFKLAISPQAIKKGHVQAQAIFLRLVRNAFPSGTIHLCHFRTLSRQPKRFVAAWNEGQLFLAPDNGVLTLLFGSEFTDYYRLNVTEPFQSPLKSAYLPEMIRLRENDFQLNAILSHGLYRVRDDTGITTPDLFEQFKTDGIISDGMIPKLDNAFDAIQAGVASVKICNALKVGGDLGTVISA